MINDDLTRWNRAGLEHFRYIDGNAPLWLERLRQELRLAFAAEQGSELTSHIHLGALGPVEFPDEKTGGDNETEAQRSEKRLRRMNRLLKNYHGERGDWGWEIARSFARAYHVLTEHVDAYANEGFLGTATQWDNVRKMVGMLGYSPAPPASASTRLALFAKTGVVEKVAAGLQVKYAPPEGGDAIVFETLENLYVDVALNEVQLKDWNVNQQPLDSPDPKLFFELDGAELSAGQWGVLVHRQSGSEHALPCQFGSVGDKKLSLGICPGDSGAWKRGESALLAGPKLNRRLRLNGTGAIAFDKPHGLSAGSAIAWQDGDNKWIFGRVREADQAAVLLEGEQQPAAGVDVYPVVRIGRNKENRLLFPASARDLPISTSVSGELAAPTNIVEYKINDKDVTAYEVADTSKPKEIYLVNGFDRKIGAVATPQEDYLLDGDATGLASGQWVLAVTESKNQALRIRTLVGKDDNSTILTFEDPQNSKSDFSGRVISIAGAFKYTLLPHDAAINDKDVPCDDMPEMTLQLDQPDDNPLSAYLMPGRRIIVEQKSDDECSNAVEATVQKYEVDPDTKVGEVTFSPGLKKGAGFTFHNTVIRGNVASAGHGAQQEEKVLGSGDATLSGQRFVLPTDGVSFVANSTMNSGVSAAVDVIVAGRVWRQVSDLSDSGPEDDHYVVHMTEDGYIAVLFGDGGHGRRLPTGNNNVRIHYRQGTGSKGNVAARSLCKLAKPHRFVEGVSQPLPALLGNDMEDMASLREQAAAGLLTLGRAVSISDFAELAAGHSSIWQARSYVDTHKHDRRNSVHVTLVPAYGTKLGSLKGEIQNFLQAHAIPGTRVVVHDFVPQYLCLNVLVFVKSAAFAPGLVMDRVRADLIRAFTLKRRRLGQSIYLSEVYEVVEAVQGVEYSRCCMGKDADKIDEWQQETSPSQEIPATDEQVIFIDESESALRFSYREFEL